MYHFVNSVSYAYLILHTMYCLPVLTQKRLSSDIRRDHNNTLWRKLSQSFLTILCILNEWTISNEINIRVIQNFSDHDCIQIISKKKFWHDDTDQNIVRFITKFVHFIITDPLKKSALLRSKKKKITLLVMSKPISKRHLWSNSFTSHEVCEKQTLNVHFTTWLYIGYSKN